MLFDTQYIIEKKYVMICIDESVFNVFLMGVHVRINNLLLLILTS